MVARYAESGRAARQELEGLLRERVIPELLDFVSKQSVASRNYWRSSLRADRHTATDYRLRTATNLAAIWTDVADELVTFQTTRDVAGKVLNGSNTYIMISFRRMPGGITQYGRKMMYCMLAAAPDDTPSPPTCPSRSRRGSRACART